MAEAQITEENFRPGVYVVMELRCKELEGITNEFITNELGIKYVPPISEGGEALVFLPDYDSFRKLQEAGVEYSTNGRHGIPCPLSADDLLLLPEAGVDPQTIGFDKNDIAHVVSGRLNGMVGVVKSVNPEESIANLSFYDLFRDEVPLASLERIEQPRQRRQS